MRNLNDEDDDFYDYSPNELAHLSMRNPELYREIVQSNLDEDTSVEQWENNNMDAAEDFLAHQRRNRR